MRIGSKQGSQSSVSSLSAMPHQALNPPHTGFQTLGMNPAALAEYYAADQGQGSASSLDFSKTLPAAAAHSGSETPRMLGSQASMQQQLMQQQQQQFQMSPQRRSASNTQPSHSHMASIPAGSPLLPAMPFMAPPPAAALPGRVADALSSSFYCPSRQAGAAGHAMSGRLPRMNEDHMLPAAAAYLQDGSICSQHTAGLSQGLQQQQQHMLMMEANATAAQAMAGGAGRKPRRASCCVVPDNEYQQRLTQRLTQLHQLYQEEQLLQEELRDSISQMGRVDQASAAGLGTAQMHQNSMARQQQQQQQQLHQEQQQKAALGVAAAARSHRRASMSLTSEAAYLQQQQQQQMVQGQQPLTYYDDGPALRSRMQGDGPRASTRHASIDISRSSRAAAMGGSFAPHHDRGLPLQLQQLLQQQKQEAMAAAGYRRKPSRASVAVVPDSNYHAQLQQLELQMHMQEQQLAEHEAAVERQAAEHALQARLLQLQQPLQQQPDMAGGRKQRRASMCVLPSAVTNSYSSQPLGSIGGGPRLSNTARDRGLTQTAYGQSTSSGFAAGSSSSMDLAMPQQAAASRFNISMSMQGRASSTAAAVSAGQYMPPAPLAHAGSGSSSASGSSVHGHMAAEFAFNRGYSSANNSMEDATAGFAAKTAAGHQHQQHQQMLLQYAQRARSGSSGAAMSTSSMSSLASMGAAVRAASVHEASAAQHAQHAQHAGSTGFVHRQLSSGSYTSYANDDTMDTTGSNYAASDAAAAAAASRHASASYTSNATPFAAALPRDVVPDSLPNARAGPSSVASRDGSLRQSLSQSMSEDQASALGSLQTLEGELQQLLDLKRKLAAAAAAAKAGTPAAAAVEAAQRKNADTIQRALAAKVALGAAASRGSEELEEMLGGRQGHGTASMLGASTGAWVPLGPCLR
jgi:hypothetical protein